MSAEEVWKKAVRYKNYWGKNGGITVSGGEALLQPEFVTELFTLAKEAGVHTALDTSGEPFTYDSPYYNSFKKLMEVTDLVILDIKQFTEESHRALTGRSNKGIIALAKELSDLGKDMWIRFVLVPGVTDSKEELEKIGDLVHSLDTVRRFEILPYHTLGLFKWEKLGVPYTLKDVPTPTRQDIERAEKILKVFK